jgi:hypothetical protein
MSKLLLILDLNKVLILRKNNKVYKRNHLPTFLKFCFGYADVAIYTSMTKKNVDLILPQIMSSVEISQLIFIWDNLHTDKDPGPYGPNRPEWSTIKSIDKIKVTYKYDRYIIIDDSADKLRFNDPKDFYICNPFEDPKKTDDELLELTAILMLKSLHL